MGSRPAARARISPLRAVNGGKGHYVGACGCTYHVQDDARVLYFDDPVMDDVVARTRPCCDTLRRCMCGGRGQAVRVQNRICCGGCVRTRGLHGLPCIPTCCVCLCEPAALRHDMPAKVNAKRLHTCVVRLKGMPRAYSRSRTDMGDERGSYGSGAASMSSGIANLSPNLNST